MDDDVLFFSLRLIIWPDGEMLADLERLDNGKPGFRVENVSEEVWRQLQANCVALLITFSLPEDFSGKEEAFDQLEARGIPKIATVNLCHALMEPSIMEPSMIKAVGATLLLPNGGA